jgi:predicted transcriptional regulator
MADARLSVRLDQQTQQRLEKETHATGKSESELVREALAAYFSMRDQDESCLDLARRQGLIGRVKGLPADLSTNRDHFKGFGR